MNKFACHKSIISAFLGISLVSICVHAAEDAKPVAVVNGVKISQDMLKQLMANALQQGMKETPEMRAALENELIVREVLSQEARKQKLDQDVEVKALLNMQQSALLADVLITRQASYVNIADEKLRIEYKRQVDLLVDAEEYELSHVVTATEAEARAIIKASRDGEPFDKLAKERSINPSRQSGGRLGWMLTNQIIPLIGNVVANMSVGTVTSMPIATPEGWQVIRVDGKRKYKAPGFEESKKQLIGAVLAQERAEFIQKLMKSANITK